MRSRSCVALLLLLNADVQIDALQQPASSMVPLLSPKPLQKHSLGTRSLPQQPIRTRCGREQLSTSPAPHLVH